MDTVYLQITSGRGPIECCRIVVLVAQEILSDAARQGLNAEIFDYKNSPDFDNASPCPIFVVV
ncbi:MAG TPA: hypothetical protein IAA88_03525 [Candidatus Avimuribaculum pullicola]|nr:hypothetical protein [Candidatus Avimuribaculum pullicola]